MRHFNLKWLFILALAPYLVGWTPADSSFNEYSVGVGGGQFASYDCAGNAHQNSFGDVGVKVTRKYATPFRVGLSASVAAKDGKMIAFAYPDIAYDSKYFSVGTTGLRIGLEDGPYAEISGFDQVPFFSGRGCFRTGVCVKPSENTHLWLGMNTIPYDKNGFAGQFDFPITSNQFLFFNGRYGESGGVPEYGFSIGTRIRLR
jgi:hypothetical protein